MYRTLKVDDTLTGWDIKEEAPLLFLFVNDTGDKHKVANISTNFHKNSK
jgi:hypothetical protein